MADEVRVPLLAESDSLKNELNDDFDVEFSLPLKDGHGPLQRRISSDQTLLSLGSEERRAEGEGAGAGSALSGPQLAAGKRKKKQFSGSEMIVAVFVVAFDTKKGVLNVGIQQLFSYDLLHLWCLHE